MSILFHLLYFVVTILSMNIQFLSASIYTTPAITMVTTVTPGPTATTDNTGQSGTSPIQTAPITISDTATSIINVSTTVGSGLSSNSHVSNTAAPAINVPSIPNFTSNPGTSATFSSKLTTATSSKASSIPPPIVHVTKAPTSFTASVSPGLGTNVCHKPPDIKNAVINSNGPFTAGKEAVYACATGFTLAGPATIKCGPDLKWSTALPQCLISADGNGGDNNIYLGDSLPLWLAIVLGMTFGVICLMLLACLVMYCLRICGCWKGHLFGEPQSTSAVAPSPTVGNNAVPEVHTVNKATGISYIDLDPFDEYQTQLSPRHPPADSRYYFTNENTRRGPAKRGNRFVEENNKTNSFERKGVIRQAKRPTKPTWMPHAQQRRGINTSTQ